MNDNIWEKINLNTDELGDEVISCATVHPIVEECILREEQDNTELEHQIAACLSHEICDAFITSNEHVMTLSEMGNVFGNIALMAFEIQRACLDHFSHEAVQRKLVSK